LTQTLGQNRISRHYQWVRYKKDNVITTKKSESGVCLTAIPDKTGMAASADDPNSKISGGGYLAFFSKPNHVNVMPMCERRELREQIEILRDHVNLTGDSRYVPVLDQLIYLHSIRDQIM
jgi:hypothetical protein